MLAIKRSSLAAVSAGIALSLVGCSDYPGDGVIDTKELRSRTAIIEAEGNVYGIETGGIDAYAVYQHDRSALINAESDAWTAYRKGEDVPTIKLQYDGDTSGFDLGAFQAALESAISEAEAKVDAEIAEDVAKAQENRDKIAQKLEEVSKGGEKFDSYVADAKAEYEAAQKALNDAIDAYNTAIESPLNKLNEIAEANGLQAANQYQNPVNSYRTMDFSDRQAPSSCPRQPRYTTVDMLSEQKTCGYVKIPSRFEPHSKEIVSATKEALLSIPKLKDQLGKKGGWNRKGSGAYATLDTAEKAYKARVSDARNKFGNNRQREYEQRHLNSSLERIDNDIARLKSEDNRNNAMIMTRPRLPEDVDAAADAYVDALRKQVAAHIVKGPEITLGEKDAEFSGFSGDYEGAVIVADFIVEANRGRENLTSVHYVDLTDEAVRNADSLSVALGRDSVSDGRYVDFRKADSVEEAIMKQIREAAQERAKRDNA